MQGLAETFGIQLKTWWSVRPFPLTENRNPWIHGAAKPSAAGKSCFASYLHSHVYLVLNS